MTILATLADQKIYQEDKRRIFIVSLTSIELKMKGPVESEVKDELTLMSL